MLYFHRRGAYCWRLFYFDNLNCVVFEVHCWRHAFISFLNGIKRYCYPLSDQLVYRLWLVMGYALATILTYASYSTCHWPLKGFARRTALIFNRPLQSYFKWWLRCPLPPLLLYNFCSKEFAPFLPIPVLLARLPSARLVRFLFLKCRTNIGSSSLSCFGQCNRWNFSDSPPSCCFFVFAMPLWLLNSYSTSVRIFHKLSNSKRSLLLQTIFFQNENVA